MAEHNAKGDAKARAKGKMPKGKSKGKSKGKAKDGKGKSKDSYGSKSVVVALQQKELNHWKRTTTGQGKGQKSSQSKSSNYAPSLGNLDMLASVETEPLVKVRLTYDTGAAVVALPESFANDYKLTGKPEGSYKTASAEIVQDRGGRTVKGVDANSNRLKLGGRVADVHKPLIAGSQIAKNADTLLWDDGGYIMPKGGVIARKMRAYMAKLTQEHGVASLTPLYIHNGVYCLDYWLHPAKGEDLAAMGEPSSSSRGPNNAAADAAMSVNSRQAKP